MSAVLAVNIGYSPRHAVLPPGSQSPRRRPRRILVIVTVLALLGAGAAYASRLALLHPAQPRPARPAALVYSSSRLGLQGPADLASDGRHIWITNSAGSSVTEVGLGPHSRPVVRSGPDYGFLAPGAIAADHGHLWVADVVANKITELAAADGSVIGTINDTQGPHSMVLYRNQLWVANPGANAVYQINTDTGKKVRVFRRNGLQYPSALAVSHDLLWIANEAKGTLTLLNPVTGAWRATLKGAAFGLDQPVAEVAGHDMLWVASAGHSITQINTATQKPVRIITGRRYRLGVPGPMALADGRLWVLNTIGNSVTEIDAATGQLVAVLAGPAYGFDRPVGITATHGAVWVVSADSLTKLVLPASARPAAVR